MNRILRYTLLTTALLYLPCYLVIALLRLRYPFELQWMEGAILDHVLRLLEGDAIYVRPSLEFIPFLYTPLYYYFSALIAFVLGNHSFLSLRLLSLLSSLGAMGTIFAFVSRETHNYFAGIMAASLFASTYSLSGYWFDLGRVDSLFICLLLIALYLVRFHSSHQASIMAGLLFTLSFLTKQSALPITLLLLLYLGWLNWRRALLIGVSTAITLLISTLVLDYLSDGWYSFYIFELPSQPYHSSDMISFKRIVCFWTHDLIRPLAITITMALIYLSATFKRSHQSAGFYHVITFALIGLAWFLRSHKDADANHLFTAYAALAILFGLSIDYLLQQLASWAEQEREPAQLFVYLLAIFQFIALAYNPLSPLPTPQDIASGQRVLATINQFEGDVFVPFHSYLTVMAGKARHAHAIPIADLIRSEIEPQRSELIAEMEQALEQHQFDAILLSNEIYLGGFERDRYYTRQSTLFTEDDESFLPKFGTPYRPLYLYVPRPAD